MSCDDNLYFFVCVVRLAELSDVGEISVAECLKAREDKAMLLVARINYLAKYFSRFKVFKYVY